MTTRRNGKPAFKPRLTEVADISEVKRNMKMTHGALDAV
ncbi:hypothetical protein BDD21_2707 [Thiocapsa rosea]|uniref:Uncharacterized protein n=1 Tax=Thiocapsa rosea TaxID=69360 RepID=A0A495V7A2_9GAMM|nr:hypothetical protein BDD21_2707 [Thiocapsa rosea]